MVRVRQGSAPLLPTSGGGQARGNSRVQSLAAAIAGLAAFGCVCALVANSSQRWRNGAVEDLGVPISLSPGNTVMRKMQILRDTSHLTSKDRYDVHYDSETGVVTMTDKNSGITTVADTNTGEVDHRRFIRGVRPHGTKPHKARASPDDKWEYNYDPKSGDLKMKNLKTGETTLVNPDKGLIKPINDFPSMDFFPGVDGNMSTTGLNGEIMDGAGQLESARAPHNSGDPHTYLPGVWKPSKPRVRSDLDGVAESPGQATFRRHFDNWYKRYLGMGTEDEYQAAYRIYSLYPDDSHPPMEGWDKEGFGGWGSMPEASKDKSVRAT